MQYCSLAEANLNLPSVARKLLVDVESEDVIFHCTTVQNKLKILFVDR